LNWKRGAEPTGLERGRTCIDFGNLVKMAQFAKNREIFRVDVLGWAA